MPSTELSNAAKSELKKFCNVKDDCDFEINQKSKWIIEISLVDGLCLLGKFKFDCRKGSMKRII
jgi:hypothetical protein